jgi:glycosyltransferase involved in cell wall biosynthesis
VATFTVVVPTVGRPTLAATLASIAGELRPGDELIVVCNNDGDFGNSARNSAIERARGSHLAFLDDDDEWVPGALAAMRRFADENPDRVGIFRHRIELVGEGPDPPDVGGPPGYVVPNIPGKVARFLPADLSDPSYRSLRPGETPEYLSVRLADANFIYSTLRLRGDDPVWVPVVTTILRPEKRKLRRLRYRLRFRTRLRRRIATSVPGSR